MERPQKTQQHRETRPSSHRPFSYNISLTHPMSIPTSPSVPRVEARSRSAVHAPQRKKPFQAGTTAIGQRQPGDAGSARETRENIARIERELNRLRASFTPVIRVATNTCPGCISHRPDEDSRHTRGENCRYKSVATEVQTKEERDARSPDRSRRNSGPFSSSGRFNSPS